MKPEDDPTWPTCVYQNSDNLPQCDDYRATQWCSHVSGALADGLDASEIEPSVRTCVPIAPKLGLYAEVAIELLENQTSVGYLQLVRKQPFSLDESLVNMGLWTRGEGRISMWSVIISQVASYDIGDKRCKQSAHGFSEEQKVSQMLPNGKQSYIDAHKFTLSMWDMCLFCWQKSQMLTGAASSGMADVLGPGGGIGNTAAGQALQNKFSSGTSQGIAIQSGNITLQNGDTISIKAGAITTALSRNAYPTPDVF